MKKQVMSMVMAATVAIGSMASVTVPVFAGENTSKNAVEQTLDESLVFADETVSMYRLYNPNSSEHFYTSSTSEKNNLVKLGWKDEGTGWTAPVKSNTPVYRLYNPNSGDHHYTTKSGERNSLLKAGWKDEGIGWYSGDSNGVPVYRQYNPNAKKAGAHNYTTSKTENDNLVKAGWRAEGIGWYGVAANSSKPTPSTPNKSANNATPTTPSKTENTGAQKYTNNTFKFQFTLPSGWTFTDDEMIKAMNDDYAANEAAREANMKFDIGAYSKDGQQTIKISEMDISELELLFYGGMDNLLDDYVGQYREDIGSKTSMGILKSASVVTLSIAGHTCKAANLVFDNNGTPFYGYQIAMPGDHHIAIIDVQCNKTDTRQQVLGAFSAIG